MVRRLRSQCMLAHSHIGVPNLRALRAERKSLNGSNRIDYIREASQASPTFKLTQVTILVANVINNNFLNRGW